MIEVRHLNFTYSGAGKSTLLDLEFGVQSGEIFGFLGPSGAGKSTTQKILIGLLQDYKGSISVFGRDLPSWKSDYYERRRGLGVVCCSERRIGLIITDVAP